MRDRPLLYAHRGAALECPENTMVAFARAMELGADAIETDVHLSSDGQVVISHDPDGRRMAGIARAIRETSRADLAAWDLGAQFVTAQGERPFAGKNIGAPTLEALLIELPNIPINVDLKQHDAAMVEAILALLRRLKQEERVTLASFDGPTLRTVRRAGYGGPTSMSSGEVTELLAMPAVIWRRLTHRGALVQIPSPPLGKKWIIDKCHALGLPVDYWTIDDPNEAQRLLALGADGIMTNDPRSIAPVFRAFRGPAQ